MMKIKLISLVVGILAFISPIQSAKADIILPGRCHMGYCSDNKFIEKTILKKGSTGTLYSVKLASRSWSFDSKPPKQFNEPNISYVYCSTDSPVYMFESNKVYVVHFLNPGGYSYGFNHSDYPIYWATCHNFVGPDFFSEEMTARAIQLGYPLDLSSDQTYVDNVYCVVDGC